MNAIKTNAACKTLYERLSANGKTGKQALIVVCNKLLKQVFTVVTNTLNQPNYCSSRLEERSKFVWFLHSSSYPKLFFFNPQIPASVQIS